MSGHPLRSLALAPSDRWSNPKSLEDSCHRVKSSYIKKTAHSQLSNPPMAASHPIWIAQLSTPAHIPCLWIIRWPLQSIRSMYYVFVFALCCFFCRRGGLRKPQVVNRLRFCRVQAWPDGSSEAYTRLRGRPRRRSTQLWRSQRADPSVCLWRSPDSRVRSGIAVNLYDICLKTNQF